MYEVIYTGQFKKSLKKWELELGIKHDEIEFPWDQPVPEEYWERVADYCANDVMATEAVFDATQSDYRTRQILSALSGLSSKRRTDTEPLRINKS